MRAHSLAAVTIAFAVVACTNATAPLATPPGGPGVSIPDPLVAVVQLHAGDIAELPQPAEAGIWLVEDSTGHRISSGVLPSFPAGITSEDYGQVVPGAAGLSAIELGFARTPVVGGAGPFRVVFVTVSAAPPSRARPN